MFYFLIFIYNILFVFAIGASYFLIKEYKRVKNNSRFLLLLYLAFGLLLFIYEFFIAYYTSDLTFFFSIVAIFIILFAIYSDRRSVFYILPIAMIGTFFNLHNEGVTFLNSFTFVIFNFLIIMSICWLITYSGINYFKIKRKGVNLAFAVTLYIILFALFLSIYKLTFASFSVNDIILLIVYETIIFTLFSITTSSIFKIIDLLYLNYFNLSKNLFDKKQSYYKMALWKKELNKKIFTEKVNFGALIFLKIDDKNLNSLKLKEFLRDFDDDMRFNYENVFYFRSSSFYYSFFVPMSENDIDLEMFYQNNNFEMRNADFFSKLEKILLDSKNNGISKKAYISIYGIDSTSIDELIKNNEYLIFEDSKNNLKYPIQIFDFRLFKNSIIERYKLSNYINKYNKFKINYFLDFSFEKTYSYNVLILNKDKKIYLSELKNEISKDEYEYLLRFFSLNAIKNFKRENFDYFIINYPIESIMSKNFNAKNFKTKIEKNFNYPLSKFIVGFEIKDFDEKRIKTLSTFLKQFEKHSFNYAILDAENYKIEFDKYLNPIIKIENRKNKLTDRLFDLTLI